MKKFIIFIVLLVVMFFGRLKGNAEIVDELYIASYYLSYENDEYNITFYANDSALFDKNSDKKPVNQTASFKGGSLTKVFELMEYTLDVKCNFKHVESVIIDVSFFETDLIDEYLTFIKNDNRFNYSFYIFACNEDIENIYGVQNVDDSSNIKNAFNSPKADSDLYLITKSLHYMKFARDFYKTNYIQKVPMIRTKDTWIIEDSVSRSILLDKVLIYGNNIKNIYSIDDYQSFLYLNDFKTKRVEEDLKFTLANYKVDMDKLFKLNMDVKVDLKSSYNVTKDEVKDYIYKEIKGLLDELYSKNIDVLNISDINYCFKKNYRYSDLKINISISD